MDAVCDVIYKALDVYTEKALFGSLFSAFVALSGFLFTVKTFIVFKMKDEVYDQDDYAARLAARPNGGRAYRRYAPLHNLSRRLSFAIVACLVAAGTQITFGLVGARWSSALSLAAAITALALLLRGVLSVRRNFDSYFEFLHSREAAKSTPSASDDAPASKAPPERRPESD